LLKALPIATMHSKLAIFVLLAIAVAGASARELQQQTRNNAAAPTFPTWAAGIDAANTTAANLTTLIAAVEAAGGELGR
jgi:hypothetical protein